MLDVSNGPFRLISDLPSSDKVTTPGALTGVCAKVSFTVEASKIVQSKKLSNVVDKRLFIEISF
jgi:hypothetical protein